MFWFGLVLGLESLLSKSGKLAFGGGLESLLSESGKLAF